MASPDGSKRIVRNTILSSKLGVSIASGDKDPADSANNAPRITKAEDIFFIATASKNSSECVLLRGKRHAVNGKAESMTGLERHFYSAYQRYARFYNFYFGRIMNPGRVKSIEAAALKPGEKVLEVGVGTGLSLPFYPKEVEVSGIDLSPEMLIRAKKLVQEEKLENVKVLEVMNAEEMSFADNQFDCVMAMHVTTVVGDPVKFAKEMCRVCKPNGRIIIVSYFHDPHTPFGKVSTKILAPYARLIGFRPDLTLEDFLSRTGLKVSHTIPVNLFKIWDVLVIKNNKGGGY